MTERRQTDPAARRRAVLLIAVAALAGALLVFAFGHYRMPLHRWMLAEPGDSAARITLMLVLLTVLLLGPLLAMSAYLWALGEKVLRAGEFPPPGLRVIRDTRIITGDAAELRGRRLKGLAVGLVVACIVMGLFIWRIAYLLTAQAD